MGYKLTGVYIRPNGTEQRIRPAGWKPGANTVAYRPLTSASTVNDKTNNGHNGTNNGVAFSMYSGVDCAYFDGSSYISVPDSSDLRGGDAYTISLWYNHDGGGSTCIDMYSKGNDASAGRIFNRVILVSPTYPQATIGATNDIGGYYALSSGWHHWLVVRSAPTTIIYIDGQLQFSGSQTSSYGTTDPVLIGVANNAGNLNYYFSGYMSNVIVENKSWTAQEVADYYNLTKGNYGL